MTSVHQSYDEMSRSETNWDQEMTLRPSKIFSCDFVSKTRQRPRPSLIKSKTFIKTSHKGAQYVFQCYNKVDHFTQLCFHLDWHHKSYSDSECQTCMNSTVEHEPAKWEFNVKDRPSVILLRPSFFQDWSQRLSWTLWLTYALWCALVWFLVELMLLLVV